MSEQVLEMATFGAYCTSCGAEVRGEFHTPVQCVEFLKGRVVELEGELMHTHYILKHFKREKWAGGAGYVIDDAEKWLERAPDLIPVEAKGRRCVRQAREEVA